MSRTALVVTAGLIAIAIGAALGSIEPAPGPAPTVPSMARVETKALIEVHVAGWVALPGVVQLAEGAIVADAIDAAGGLKPGAASHTINLAAPVRAGDQIYVAGPDVDQETPTGDGLVSVNQADASDLEQLPGVGPVLAERIVSYREDNGPFNEVEDLLDVPGIGESKLASMRDLIRVP